MSDPAEKYRDKLDPLHTMMMDSIFMAYQVMATQKERLDEFLEAERRAHSIGHITDPTLYRDMINSQSFARQLKVARAAKAFLAIMDEVIAELPRIDEGAAASARRPEGAPEQDQAPAGQAEQDK